ncbi:hypothetical protein MGYG_03216 [Nannizzia gypsea CBS 118893]|uniref:Uncharacterized protein n=1 Tax=Arthroderma gypseum (strain ATCC MYA-4604 / CBS 118893) TaxID=535722 RepID=E4URK3_ARTGP|nr:hypothetical protein MGYG_03216 [Nannizzia gypsea CBS 118893]EFR00213.1 hypothetical protein MGYG_03216 [Nannizzia gypsea CBS 118893]
MNGALVDPAQCFSHLVEHIPLWLTRVTELASHTAAKHAEFAAEYTRISKLKPRQRRRRNSSLNTNKGEDDQRSVNSRTKPSSGSTYRHLDAQDPFRDPMIFKRLTRQNNQDALNRKRKQQDSASSTPSDPDSCLARRVRQQVVIHYDSQTQTVLELLVRDIGGARNQIRKGRMNYMMKVDFSRRAFPSHIFPTGSPDDDENTLVLPHHASFRRSRSTQFDPKHGTNGTATKTTTPSKQTASAFDLTDKQLEIAQSLCETAAHQFLRNGDCSKELSKTLERLNAALEMAKAEVTRLKAEKEAEKLRQQAEEEEQESKSDRTVVETVGPADADIQMQADTLQPVNMKVDMNLKGDIKAPPEMMGAIEVDDGSSTSSISIDLAAFRRRRFKA